MNKILIPKKSKINDTEEVALPMVKCSFCHNMTMTGLHQIRLEMVKKGEMKIENGKRLYKPPVMKKIDIYMCTNCVKKGTKWPGQRP
jgi:polyhydroxyalkanoate synthesis regulator phasin